MYINNYLSIDSKYNAIVSKFVLSFDFVVFYDVIDLVFLHLSSRYLVVVTEYLYTNNLINNY